ncbi:MAG: hypothetical protein ISS67_05965 [Desulfobacterales bacterium]|uniref:Uncharacterized protein n=1 Tax=Candidatus Desulfatibia profunda TaxID=2841695 RepID=A0A8J6NQP4_9BACT|nr:hypothetical protein [Candidatus Desulfatibia profunda]MBL7180274.1 hypothetical protein [Desulfobacterales bacterium]MBL7208051.1 hypothetical protein [Desulfobacterales bacterium]
MKLPFDFDLGRPMVEIETEDHHIKVYASGRIEGMETLGKVTGFHGNRIAALICQYNAHHELALEQ